MKKFNCIFLIVISVLVLLFTYNDDFLYKNEIMKITKIDTIKEDIEQNSLGLSEKYYTKNITGIITNGKNKGTIKSILYEESYSSVVTDKYKVGDKVILDKNSIDNLKRDFYIVLMILLFIILIYIVGEVKGLLSVLSVIINSFIFYLGLMLYFKGIDILFITVIEIISFSIISLFIAGGINKKTISAIISTVTSIILILLMLLIVVKLTNYKGITFNDLAYLTVPAVDIILPELLIGAVGAIMDVAITISSSISELIDKDKNITLKNLNKSSKEIGKDIMSTMSNVLFFTYICAGLPIFVLAIRNGFTIKNFITTNFTLELTRFLVGSIGILASIPIATFISIKIFKRGEV
ncbi:MAG: YibE/F family protein [Bacilli bacterium]|nr:YibE/F family protein [Bacilli bacterium]